MREKPSAIESTEAKLNRLKEVLALLPAKYGALPLGVAPKDRRMVTQAIREIGVIGGQQAYELLTKLLLDHTYRSFIMNIAEVLRQMGRSADAAQLILREYSKLPHLPLDDVDEDGTDVSPQTLYIRALAFLQESCALPFLTAILEHYIIHREHQELALSAIHALAYIGDFGAFGYLLRAAQISDLHHSAKIGLGILCGVTQRVIHFPDRIPHAIPKLKEAMEQFRAKYPKDRRTLTIADEVLKRAQKTLKTLQTKSP
jgi:hypothetical protein